MIAQSFEITAHISKSTSCVRSSVFHRWFCSLVVSCLTCDHKVGGSIPCQAKATLLISSKIVLCPQFRLKLSKNSESLKRSFIMSNELCCCVIDELRVAGFMKNKHRGVSKVLNVEIKNWHCVVEITDPVSWTDNKTVSGKF